MKIKPDHFDHLKKELERIDIPALRTRYKAAGLSTTRYQWDCVRKAGLTLWLCDNLYSYLDDSHIQTALNRIIKPL